MSFVRWRARESEDLPLPVRDERVRRIGGLVGGPAAAGTYRARPPSRPRYAAGSIHDSRRRVP
ncbi:hypothetical protein GCM10010394_22880 [Streptomyces crystallinus]|uniref:Uncharacterized protein n=1 Tax=Streptomyces crystallinus TaxID=68191 RepID=A0ABP3QPH4_9ACTN